MSTQNLSSNFHPEIAKLIDRGRINSQNAAILNKIPIDKQCRFIDVAQWYNEEMFNLMVNAFLEGESSFNLYYPKNKEIISPDKKVLFVIKEKINHWALIPQSKINHLDLNEFNGCSLGDKKTPSHLKDEIITLAQRLGIIHITIDEEVKADLKEYLNPTPPFQIDELCWISL
jgi:hypothetical protein